MAKNEDSTLREGPDGSKLADTAKEGERWIRRGVAFLTKTFPEVTRYCFLKDENLSTYVRRLVAKDTRNRRRFLQKKLSEKNEP